MPNAHIDQNDIKTWIGLNDTTGAIEPLQVDPVTGALLVYNVGTTSITPASLSVARRDENDMPTMLGFNDTTGNTECLRFEKGGLLTILQ